MTQAIEGEAANLHWIGAFSRETGWMAQAYSPSTNHEDTLPFLPFAPHEVQEAVRGFLTAEAEAARDGCPALPCCPILNCVKVRDVSQK